jgi:MinD-like ATPase involved in chromosome partitioning or flagellar assembly
MLVTFCSYKPEVGCTMAAVNIGILLCQDFAKRVLIVDFNFAAPRLAGAVQEISEPPQSSLFDFFVTYQKAIDGDLPITGDSSFLTPPGVNATSVDGFDYLPASKQRSVLKGLVAFDWNVFYRDYYGGALIEEIKNHWVHAYDYVFVTSGKGFTDSASICTVQLADVIVLMMDASPDSFEGSLELARRVNAGRIKRDRKTVTILPVRTRVNMAERELYIRNRERIENAFSEYLPRQFDVAKYFDEVQIPESPYFAATNDIAVLKEKRHALSISRSYGLLSQYVLDMPSLLS